MPPMTWLDSLLHCWGTDPSKTGIGASHEPWRGGPGPYKKSIGMVVAQLWEAAPKGAGLPSQRPDMHHAIRGRTCDLD